MHVAFGVYVVSIGVAIKQEVVGVVVENTNVKPFF
jgi:hypothetical protein